MIPGLLNAEEVCYNGIMRYKNMKEQLFEAKFAISNGIADSFIRAALEPFKYTEDRMGEGLRLVEKADGLLEDHLMSKYRQAKAWGELEELWQNGKKEYSHLRILSKHALRGKPGLVKSLSLETPIRETLAAWIEQVRIFYTNSLKSDEILNQFDRFGVTRKTLKDLAKTVENIEKAQTRHKRKKADTHRAKIKRDEAFQEVRQWMIPYRSICRVALDGHPEQLGKLKPL